MGGAGWAQGGPRSRRGGSDLAPSERPGGHVALNEARDAPSPAQTQGSLARLPPRLHAGPGDSGRALSSARGSSRNLPVGGWLHDSWNLAHMMLKPAASTGATWQAQGPLEAAPHDIVCVPQKAHGCSACGGRREDTRLPAAIRRVARGVRRGAASRRACVHHTEASPACVCVCARVCVCLPERFRLWLDGAWVGAPLPAHESPPPAQPGSTSMGAAARTAATVPAPAHRPPPARPCPPARSDRERSVAQSRGWANKPGARPRRVGGSRADRRKPSVAPTHPVVAGRRRSDRTRIEQVAS